MKISWGQLESEVWRLFGLLPSKFTSHIKGRWKRLGSPLILDDPKIVDTALSGLGYKVDWAATDGFNFWFRLDKINDDGIDIRLVILHELAHCYFLAIRHHYLHHYRDDESYRNKCEKETQELSEKWFKKFCKNAKPPPNVPDTNM